MQTTKNRKATPGTGGKAVAAKTRTTAPGVQLAGSAPGAVDPSRVLAREVMHGDVLVLRADDSIRAAAEQLEEVGGGAPVVDASGRLVGVLTSTDIARSEHVADDGVTTAPASREVETLDGMIDQADADEEVFSTEEYDSRVLGGLRVADWMTPHVVQVAPDATVEQIAQRMLTDSIHRVFVVDRDRLVGAVSTEDLIRLLAGPTRGKRSGKKTPATRRDGGAKPSGSRQGQGS